MWILFWIVLIKVVLVQSQDNCPINETAINLENRYCFAPCENKLDCRNKRTSCLCDGPCGMSCVAPDIKCSKPPKLENGEIIFPESLVFGSKIIYKCNDGYNLIGPRERICNAEKYFSGTEPVCNRTDHCQMNETAINIEDRNCYAPCDTDADCRNKRASCSCDGPCGMSCIPAGIKCTKPESLENGEILLPESLEFGSSISYKCNDGYDLIGPRMSICNAERYFGGKPPVCVPIESCSLRHYFEFENGYKRLYEDGRQIRDKTRYSKVKHDGEIHFTCYTGYEVQIDNEILASPYLTVKCQRGQWDKNIPVCRPARCPCNKLRQEIEKRKLISENCTNYATHNSQVNLECHQEFPEFHGIEDAAKCSFGVWDIPNSKCTYESCGLEDYYPLENGSVKLYEDGYEARGKNKYGKIKHGGKAVYRCDQKFELHLGNEVQESSTLELTCQKGEWEKTPPTCKPARCPCKELLSKTQRLKLHPKDCREYAMHGSEIDLQCDHTYPEFHGPSSVAKCSFEKWNIPNSQCTLESCSLRDYFEFENGYKTLYEDGRQVRGKTRYSKVKHDGEIHFTCYSGYEMQIDNEILASPYLTVKCQRGQWDRNIPVCRPVEIPEEPMSDSSLKNCILGKVSNGIFRRITDNNLLETGTVIKNEEIVKFECNEGFKIQPGITSDEVQCRNGKFQPENLSCSPKTWCRKPEFPHGGLTYRRGTSGPWKNLFGEGLQQNTRIKFTCGKNFNLILKGQIVRNNVAYAKCNRGKWVHINADSNSITEYIPKCKDESELTQGSVKEEIELSSETNVFEPNSDEDWSNVTEKQETEYNDITEIPGGSCSFEVTANVMAFHNNTEIQRNGNYSSGSLLIFRCKDIGKFHFSGKTILQCLNGRWNEEMPKCTELNLRDRNSAPVLDYEVESETFDIEPNGTLVIYAGDTLTMGCHWFSFYGEPKWIVTQANSEQKEPPGEWNEERTIYQLIKIDVTEESSGIYQCMNPRTRATNNINVRVIKEIISPTTNIATTTSEIISQWATPKDNSDFNKNETDVPKINPSFGSFCTFYPGHKNIIAFYEGKPVAAGSQIEENSEITVRCSNINSFATNGANKVTCKNSYWFPRLPACYYLYKNSEFTAPPINFESSSYEILEDGTVLLHSSLLTIYCLYARVNYQNRSEIVYQKPNLTTAGEGCPLYSDLIFDNIQKAFYQIYDVSMSTTFEIQCIHPFKPQLKHKIVFTTSDNLRLRRTEENCQKCLYYTNDRNLKAYYQGQQISNLTQIESDATVSFICSNISFYLLRGEKKLRCDKGRWSNLIPTCERLISGDGKGAPPITFSRQDFQVDEDGIVILTPSVYSLSVSCERRKYNQNTGQFDYPIFDVTKGSPHRSGNSFNYYLCPCLIIKSQIFNLRIIPNHS